MVWDDTIRGNYSKDGLIRGRFYLGPQIGGGGGGTNIEDGKHNLSTLKIVNKIFE